LDTWLSLVVVALTTKRPGTLVVVQVDFAQLLPRQVVVVH
jgi:hypothetical protein